MYSFSGLTDHDFEMLVADLFSAEEGRRYESFARGRDLGVDVRHERDDGREDIVQCKHFVLSSVSSLIAAARKERKRLEQLDPPPASYRLVTSRRLTRENKRAIVSELRPYVRRQRDVWGKEDLERLLARHERVERSHIKLWLPSSAQLRAIVDSATYSRSRALVDEILEALPRWVPGPSFHDARAILRREKICVIAGVPGIGKTTLAKLLVADAIDDGYAAIHVSSDIEEAWKVYDPGTKQVFYYDDFLGRTALTQRLGKNEEDRLLQFMRRAAGSQTTLFVLTTREYILQQAQDLYEQLAIEGVEGRKFLLQLGHYARVDRARIFYNHAYLSNQLSRRARQALLRDRAYEAIIDHPKYNPRQIEWITGLSAHELTKADNDDYVAFATAALDDPTRIWRHGFEHQLDKRQRALLLSLATMPDRVEHDDLERAFESYCVAASIDTGGRAFERALRVIDDSFVRTYHDVGRVFVTTYDPSVADFLSQYLATSAADALAAVRGAVFFEQVENLARILCAPDVRPADGAVPFAAAFARTWDAPSCTWGNVYIGRHATEPTTRRWSAELEKRLTLVRAATSWYGPFARPEVARSIRATYDAGFRRILETWNAGSGERHLIAPFLGGMREHGEDLADAVAAAKAQFRSGLHFPQSFGALLAFRDLVPDAYSAEEWQDLRSRYTEVAVEELSNWEEMGDLDEIDQIERYADRMGAELDANRVRRARENLELAIDEAEDRAREADKEHDAPDEPDERDVEQTATAEIDAMFARLADS